MVVKRVSNVINNIKDFFLNFKEKYGNLKELNYRLGLAHLKSGRIVEAKRRFRIILFFWPSNFKAASQYAYCLILMDKARDAQLILDRILDIDMFNKLALNLHGMLQTHGAKEIRERYRKIINRQ